VACVEHECVSSHLDSPAPTLFPSHGAVFGTGRVSSKGGWFRIKPEDGTGRFMFWVTQVFGWSVGAAARAVVFVPPSSGVPSPTATGWIGRVPT
jgi:hypothetical protein